MKESLDFIGFILSGGGAIFFFFIYAILIKTTIFAGLNSEYISHTISIKESWIKNINNKNNFVVKEILKDSDLYDKSEWTLKKKFAFWALDKGTALSFGLVAVGFVLQLFSKFL